MNSKANISIWDVPNTIPSQQAYQEIKWKREGAEEIEEAPGGKRKGMRSIRDLQIGVDW